MGCVRSPVRVRTPRLVLYKDLYQSLFNAALRFVSYRPRSRKELVDFLQKKLQKWNIASSAIFENVVKRVEELGYIDDAKFASWWVEQRNSFRPKGIALLARELYQKGISRELIEQTLQKSSGDEMEAARIIVGKKLKLFARLPKLEQKKKLYGFLGRRGFPSEVISRVVDEITSKGV